MDLTTLRAFFLWCTILNAVILGLSALVCVFLGEWSYQMNNRFFFISREAFNTLICSFIALYKLFILTFNLAPYIALLIIG